MYWRAGTAHVLLWVASVTLALCALAALVRARSPGAALCFLAAAAVLAPPGQETIARLRNAMAPAKAALYSSVLFVPIGLGFVIVDGVATLDREARGLGFASAGQWARAKDLKLTTPQALAAYDDTRRASAMEAYCKARAERQPLACFAMEHQRSAKAYADARLAQGELEAVIRDAVAQQRKAYLAADKDCTDLLNRIDEDALPVMLENRDAALSVVAAAWARHFSRAELEQLLARSKPGNSYLTTGEGRALDAKLGALAPAIEKELDLIFQVWARQIVISEPTWRVFLKGHKPVGPCKPAQQAG